MPRDTLSPEFVGALMAQRTGIVPLYLVDIWNADFDEPIRIVNNTEDVICLGNTYAAVGFDLRLPDAKDGVPRGAQISIDNTTQWLTPTLRTVQGQFDFGIRLAIATDANASPPVYDSVEIEYMPMQLFAIQFTDSTVVGTLGFENLANAQWPPQSFDPHNFRGLFGDNIRVSPASEVSVVRGRAIDTRTQRSNRSDRPYWHTARDN